MTDNPVYYDPARKQMYWIEWEETGNSDIPTRHYLPEQAPELNSHEECAECSSLKSCTITHPHGECSCPSFKAVHELDSHTARYREAEFQALDTKDKTYKPSIQIHCNGTKTKFIAITFDELQQLQKLLTGKS